MKKEPARGGLNTQLGGAKTRVISLPNGPERADYPGSGSQQINLGLIRVLA